MQGDVKKTTPNQHDLIGRVLLGSSEKDRKDFDEEFKQWLKERAQKGAQIHA